MILKRPMMDNDEEDRTNMISSDGTKEVSMVPSGTADTTKKDGYDIEVDSTDEDATQKSADNERKEKEDKDDTPMETPSVAKLFQVANPELPGLCVAALLMIAAETSGLITPLILGNAYDTLVDQDISDDERLSDINRIVLIVLAVHFSGVVAGFLRATIMGIAGERLVARLRNQLYASILSQEIAFFDAHKSGELVSRLGSDTTLLQTVVAQSFPESVLGIMKVCVTLALMFWISAKLAGLTVALVIVLMGVSAPFGKLLARLSKDYQSALGQAQTRSTEAFGAMRTVQSFAAEEREAFRFSQEIGDPDLYKWWWPTNSKNTRDNQESAKTTYSMGVYKATTAAAFFTFIFGCGFGGMYFTLWYAFHLVTRGEMTLGQLTAFQSYIFTVGFSLGHVSAHIAKAIEGLGASGRIFYLLERIPLIPAPTPKAIADGGKEAPSGKEEPLTTLGGTADIFVPTLPPQKPNSMEGVIEFHNVNFVYPTRLHVPVLKDFTLTVPANTTAALVGSSGAGKSTVVALLQRFYEVSGGSIRIDGIDIRNLDLKWLRNQIGYVQQEPQLFGLTVRENVMYGVNRDVSQDELEQACKQANAHDFVTDWPKGYDTMVGERGVKLSGGQKQRLAIARALLTNCRILLLDEATSALDAESEHLVQEAIDKAVAGRTVVIVAHRLSTIRRASQIVVMDQHRIVDVGTHDELWARCAKYSDLIKRQQGHVK